MVLFQTEESGVGEGEGGVKVAMFITSEECPTPTIEPTSALLPHPENDPLSILNDDPAREGEKRRGTEDGEVVLEKMSEVSVRSAVELRVMKGWSFLRITDDTTSDVRRMGASEERMKGDRLVSTRPRVTLFILTLPDTTTTSE